MTLIFNCNAFPILMRPDSSVSRIHIRNIRPRNPKFGKIKFSVSFRRNVVDLDPELFEYVGCGSGYGMIMRSHFFVLFYEWIR
jgi:hypothetical protein